MYPLSSKIDKKKNSTTIIGKNDKTLPTPAKIPSIIREWTTGFNPYAVNARSAKSVTISIPTLSQSERPAPITPKVSQNISPIIAAKAGSAVYFPVSILSAFTLLACALLSVGLTTVCVHTFSINLKRISARAASRSFAHSSSIS